MTLGPTSFVTEEGVEMSVAEIIRNTVCIPILQRESGILVWTSSDVAPHALRAVREVSVPSGAEVVHLIRPVGKTKRRQPLPLVRRDFVEIVSPA